MSAARTERTATHVRGLYGMVDVTAASAGPGDAERLARALLDGGVGILQLRMKHAGARAMLRCAESLSALCASRGALFVVNDRLDVAIAIGAGGVHLGQDDLPLAAARAIAPDPMLIGISTHDEAQADAAWRGGADYLAFGPVFATRSKDNPDPVVGVERLARVCAAVRVPVVAIGGIDLESVNQVAAAGAVAAAIISAVNSARDVTAAARAAARAFVPEY